MATFGIAGRRAQAIAWGMVIAAELGLAAGVIAGSPTAAYLAAALMATFAATMVSAILRGRAGAPCACFGARSTVGWPAVARNAALAVAFAALPALPGGELSTDQWLGLGLAVALLACAALAAAVLVLAREVGVLRLRLGAEGTLELTEEGPPLFADSGLEARLEPGPEAVIGLAVFTSSDCRGCRALEPSVAALVVDPRVAVVRFDEQADAEAWSRLGIARGPFAIALDLDGAVLAKAAVRDRAQLELVVAAGKRRRAERELAAAAGI